MSKKHKNDIGAIIYSKWCLTCDHMDWLNEVNAWAQANKIEVKVVRTAYKPKDHKRATELWAAKTGLPEEEAVHYPSFIVHNDIIKLRDFVEMIKDAKNKLTPEGGTKDDMQGLPKAKRTRRKNRVVSSVNQAKNKDEA